jgi:hypothetical protein
MNRHLETKKANATKTYAETTDHTKYRLLPAFERTVQPNPTWAGFMRDCAFYFDAPTVDDQISMKRKLQREYDGILPEGWRPQLNNRRSLLQWACSQQNEASAAPVDNCENYSALLETYGPNYDSLRSKLGDVRGLWSDSDARHFN